MSKDQRQEDNSLMGLVRRIPVRGKFRVVERLCPRHGEVLANVCGFRIPLDLGLHLDRGIYVGGYELLNTHRFRRILRPGMTVVDVGANIGYFTLLAARLVGRAGQVIAIEPHPKNLSVLEGVVAHNGLEQVVHVKPIALGDRSGHGTIWMAPQEAYPNRTATMLGSDRDQGHTVPVSTLDRSLTEWKVEEVNLLKIDVDGYETNVLHGSRDALLEGRIRNILVEFNPHWLQKSHTSPSELSAYLTGLGFEDVSSETRWAQVFLGPTDDRHFRHRTCDS